MFKRALLVLEPEEGAEDAVRRGLMNGGGVGEVIFYTGLGRGHPPWADLPDLGAAALREPAEDARTRTGRLHARAQHLADGLGVLSHSVITVADDPVRAIVDMAQARRCDVIMASSEGDNALVRLLGGSVIPGLVTASPVPVMICSPRPAGHTALGLCVGQILIVLDDSGPMGAAFDHGLVLARDRSADLLFVHVAAAGPGPVVDVAGMVMDLDDRLTAEAQRQSQDLVSAACRLAAQAGLRSRGMSLQTGTTANDITQLALEQGCSLVVVGHSGQNALVRLLSGSVIPGLITSATVPVLICRDTGRPPAQHGPRRRWRRRRAVAAAAAARASHGPAA